MHQCYFHFKNNFYYHSRNNFHFHSNSIQTIEFPFNSYYHSRNNFHFHSNFTRQIIPISILIPIPFLNEFSFHNIVVDSNQRLKSSVIEKFKKLNEYYY